MPHVFKLLIISFLVIGCKTGHEVDKRNIDRFPESSISNHNTKVTQDIAGAASAVSQAAKK